MGSSNRVAIVTGASSGIGWELARQLADEGYKVGLTARRRENLEALAGAIQAAGGTAALAPADAGDRAQVQEAFRRLTGELGPIDLLLANAGVGFPTLLEPMNMTDIEQMFRVNVLGLVYALEAVLPEMLRRRCGHLVAVSSLAAYKGLPGESAYCASKAAVNTYMEGLRIQLRGRGIAVTTVCPGFVQTPMTAANEFHMPWLLDAAAAARRIIRAVKRRRAVCNFPWQMNLFMKTIRWLPDWILARGMNSYNKNPPFPPHPTLYPREKGREGR
jgi:short-subunit dehydrogenase